MTDAVENLVFIGLQFVEIKIGVGFLLFILTNDHETALRLLILLCFELIF